MSKHPVIIFLNLIIAICMSAIPASSDSPKNIFDMDIDELMQIEIVSLASGTPMLTSEAPGIVTVLYGEDMMRSGYLTVIEALSHVPGLYVMYDWTFTYRGLGKTQNSGKILYKLNGLDTAESLSQQYYPFMVPMDIVERIEIVRGPGSALYGKGAFLATVNIITKDNDNRAFLQAGSFDTQGMGFNVSKGTDELKLNLSLFTWQRGDTGRSISADMFIGTPYEPISNAPGRFSDSKRMPISGILKLQHEGFTLRAQSWSYQNAAAFGMTGALPPYEDDYAYTYRMNQLSLSHEGVLAANVQTKAAVGYRDYKYVMDDFFLFPAGFMGFPYDMRGGPHYLERTYYATMQAVNNTLGRHSVIAGAEYEKTKIADTYQTTNYDPVTYAPIGEPTTFRGEMNWIDENARREIMSIYVQDIYEATEQLKVTVGARYDSYSDSEDMLTPRASLVYSPAQGHHLKAQYARGFRPPTFLEIYSRNNPIALGNAGLEAEEIETYEIGYTRVLTNAKLDMTGFYSNLDEMIDIRTGQYANIGKATSRGVEVELNAKPVDDISIKGFISYVDARDKQTDEAVPGSFHWIGDMVLRYHASEHISASASLSYRSRMYLAPSDPKPYSEEATKVDLALLASNTVIEGVSVGVGLKNVFDERVFQQIPNYPGGINELGRTWWVSMSAVY